MTRIFTIKGDTIMKRKIFPLTLVVLLVLLLGVAVAAAQDAVRPNSRGAVSTGFTYQGQLKKDGSPVNGPCDMAFRLYDAAELGAQVGSAISRTVPISGGLFTVGLDFGPAAFAGDERWLGIQVKCSGDGDYVSLGRQELAAAPYAHYALGAPWSGLDGIPAGFADGVDNQSVVVSGTNVFAGEGLDQVSTGDSVTLSLASTYQLPQACGDGAIAEWDSAASLWECGVDDQGGGAGGDYWSLTGNAGTSPGTNFVGTSDNVDLTLAVNGAAALRLELSGGAPNLIGGYSGNSVASGVQGATIGGGGASGEVNQVSDDYGVVGGGYGNQAGDAAGTTGDAAYATVGGGWGNVATGYAATVAGGRYNEATSDSTAIGGGQYNEATAMYATVAGGRSNIVTATHAAIGGGRYNDATADYVTVGGGYNNDASGDYATISGGQGNDVSAEFATVPGGGSAKASLYGQMAYASGGFYNPGDAQAGLYVLRNSTYLTSQVELFLDGESERLVLESGRTLTFDILVVARTPGGQSAGYSAQGIIENYAGFTNFIGTPTVTTLGEDRDWDVVVEADDTNDALVIKVVDEQDYNVRWVATVRTVEVMH
jgi:hypothetical protein